MSQFKMSSALEKLFFDGLPSGDNNPITTNRDEAERVLSQCVTAKLVSGEIPLRSFIRFNSMKIKVEDRSVVITYYWNDLEVCYLGPFIMTPGSTLNIGMGATEGKIPVALV